jgi:hypothetical protein
MSSPELPAEVALRVLWHHAGDVPTLCAAACVARSWRAAAGEPRLWRDLRWGHAVGRLTDERLAALVARASGSLSSMQPFHDDTEVTDFGVADALEGLAAPLARLHVHGVHTGYAYEDGEEDEHPGYTTLRALVRSDSSLDISRGAICSGPPDPDGGFTLLCSRACNDNDQVCEHEGCGDVLCATCEYEMFQRKLPTCEHVCACCYMCVIHGGGSFQCGNEHFAEVPHSRHAPRPAAWAPPRHCHRCVFFCSYCDLHVCDNCRDNVAACACVGCDGCYINACGECSASMDVCSNAACRGEASPRRFCDVCVDERGRLTSCGGEACKRAFCDACKPACLARVAGGPGDSERLRCAACLGGSTACDDAT